ncbi:DUF4198 domain-containing protein [Chrysiogenes arsenatis]|uniref:DUF4198 domain-containing protein n=1 Tax=Chrysiogenes arsenatis TaxID=309797 RepID=UPI00040A3834|nr:DUF4198 domain-containing protein [Chrysiogenes arsenatis]
MKKLSKISLLFAIFCVFLTSAQAHYLWLERENQTLRFYFGEWHKDLFETTGGRLDNFQADVVVPEGVTTGSERKADHVAISLKKAGDVGIVEAMAPRKSRLSDEVTRSILLGRAGRSEASALLPLDLVPAQPHSSQFTLVFDGAPVPNAKITVYTPAKEEFELATDGAGGITIDTSKAGQYLVLASHFDETGGELDGVRYDKTRYALTLSFRAD